MNIIDKGQGLIFLVFFENAKNCPKTIPTRKKQSAQENKKNVTYTTANSLIYICVVCCDPYNYDDSVISMRWTGVPRIPARSMHCLAATAVM